MMSGIYRAADHPVARTRTRRKQLVQELRNELAAHKNVLGDLADPRTDQRLARITQKFEELLRLEGLAR